MQTERGSLEDYVQRLQKKDKRLLDFITAETPEEFDQAFDWLLEKAVTHIEQNKIYYQASAEDAISSVFVARISAVGVIVAEQQYSNGHVDITIEAQCDKATWRKLGEAKIYDGPAYHMKGLKQLLGRYTTGRECCGLMIEYVRLANVAGLIKKIRDEMDEKCPMAQLGATKDYPLKWSFLSTHMHSSGEALDVAHVACNLFIEERAVGVAAT